MFKTHRNSYGWLLTMVAKNHMNPYGFWGCNICSSYRILISRILTWDLLEAFFNCVWLLQLWKIVFFDISIYVYLSLLLFWDVYCFSKEIGTALHCLGSKLRWVALSSLKKKTPTLGAPPDRPLRCQFKRQWPYVHQPPNLKSGRWRWGHRYDRQRWHPRSIFKGGAARPPEASAAGCCWTLVCDGKLKPIQI